MSVPPRTSLHACAHLILESRTTSHLRVNASRLRKNYRNSLQLLLRVSDAIGLQRRGPRRRYSRSFDRIV